MLTVLGGVVVQSAGNFAGLAPALPAVMPDWSPVLRFGGYQRAAAVLTVDDGGVAAACGCNAACGLHGHAHGRARGGSPSVADAAAFWGAFGCSC